ncbi:DUF7344 domain-containing protein [Haladaptatus sp. NG-WS-4]
MSIETTSGSQTLTPDVAFEILTNARRRYTLAYLRSQSDAVSIGELAEAVAAWEHDTTTDLVSSKERKSVYTSLYQTHLPKMADAGVIEYDRQRGIVQLADRAEELDDYLSPTMETPNWSGYYLTIAVVGGTAIVCNVVGMYPFTEVPVLAYVGLLLGSVAVLSAVNIRVAHKNRDSGA